MRRSMIAIAAVALAVAACGGDSAVTTTTPATTSAPTTTADAPPTTAAPVDASGAPVAKVGDLVSVNYTGTLDDGSVFDTSIGREPFSFEIGSGQVIAGFDEAVRGLAVGETITVRIPAEDAYGPVDPELIFPVPIEQAPDGVAVGDEVLIGKVTPGRVVDITDTEVFIDTNPRFAGQALTFEIELLSIDG